jgi:hypothetical protein
MICPPLQAVADTSPIVFSGNAALPPSIEAEPNTVRDISWMSDPRSRLTSLSPQLGRFFSDERLS